MTRSVFLTAAALLCASSVVALPPLGQNKSITDGMIAVGLAIEISDRCPDLAPRTLRGVLFLNSLKSDARKQGYTSDQIDAFVSDKAEKQRLEQQARAYLASKGAAGDDADAFCKVGRAEIAAKSQAGRLLRD